MRRWQLFSMGAVLLTAAGFATGSLQSLASYAGSGQCAPKVPGAMASDVTASGDQCTSGQKATAGKPDPFMSMMCERSCAAKNYDKATVVAQPGAHDGQLTRCPVSGVVFKVQKDNAAVKYAGKEWVTCCGSCAKKLVAAPERFLGPLISGGGGARVF
jgi:hypothetical protein